MSELHERFGKLEGDVKALHRRLDDDVRHIDKSLDEIGKDVKGLLAWKNKVAGIVAATMLFGTVFGWVVSLIFKH